MTSVERKNIYLLMTGRLISFIGTGIQTIAIPLFILDLTGSAAMMGIFTLLSIIPSLAFSPLSGVLGDRYNKKRIMVIADLMRGLLVFILLFLFITFKPNLIVLLIFQIAISIFNSLFTTSSIAILPEIISSDSLSKGNAIKSATDNISLLIGPVLGGIVYGYYGIKVVFIINAISFVLSAIFEWLLLYESKLQITEKFSLPYFIQQVKEVLNYIKSNSKLKTLFLLILFFNFFDGPVYVVVLPYVYKKVLGYSSQSFGALQSVLMGGMLLGDILLVAKLSSFKPFKSFKLSNILQFTCTILLALITFPFITSAIGKGSISFLIVSMAVVLIIGLSNAIANTIVITQLQKTISTDMLARFFSIAIIAFEISNPVGSLLFGLMLDLTPYYMVFMLVAVILFIGAIVAIRSVKNVFLET